MTKKILVIIINLLLIVTVALTAYNKGFDHGYVTGLVAQGLGFDSFTNYDMPYTDVDNDKKKWE